jgi:hypothetical protein
MGGCANRANRSRLPGPHALPAQRTISLEADIPSSRVLGGRVVGNVLQVYVNISGGVRAVNVPMGGQALSVAWAKTPNIGNWLSGMGPDGTLFMSAAGTYALDPTSGNELGGWSTTAPPATLTDLLPAPGPTRGVFLSISGSAGAVCLRNALSNQWCVSEQAAAPGNVAVAPDGDVLWAWRKSTSRSAYRLGRADGATRWGPVQTNSNVPVLADIMAASDRTFFFAQSGGIPHYVEAQSTANGSNAWGPVNRGPSTVSGRTLLSDNSLLVANEGSSGLVGYSVANGASSVLVPATAPGGIVSDRDGWIYLAESNGLALRAYAPPYAAQSWSVAIGGGCGAPILAAGFVIFMCNDTLNVVGP